MSKAKALPDDLRQLCIQLVRGYDRRVRDYYDRRREIVEGTSVQYTVLKDPNDPDGWKNSAWVYQPKAHNASRTTESIAERILALEDLPDTKYMRAVEQAQLRIGLDLPEDMRQKLVKAIMLNCTAGRRYPFECLDVEGIERTNFYNRRTVFLIDIARYLDFKI